MNTHLPVDQHQRVQYLVDLAWEVFFERVASGKVKVNKESSMQLHYASVLYSIGETFCILPAESFSIELESGRGKQNIDITLSLGEVKAAIELKCFRKRSKRAVDTDMYDTLKDIERLLSFDEYQVKKFICLSDNTYYADAAHKGHAGSVTIKEGTQYKKGTMITPSWEGKWKDKTRDKPIHSGTDLLFRWVNRNGWYALVFNL